MHIFRSTGIVHLLSEQFIHSSWWRHQMETFSAWLAFCAGNSPVFGGFPSHRSVTRSFGVFFDLRLNKRLKTQSTRRWFDMPSHSLWRHSTARSIDAITLHHKKSTHGSRFTVFCRGYTQGSLMKVTAVVVLQYGGKLRRGLQNCGTFVKQSSP